MKLHVADTSSFHKGCVLRFDRDNTQYVVTRIWGPDTLTKKILRFFRIRIPINVLKVKKYEP